MSANGPRVDGPARKPPTWGPEPAVELAGRSWCWWDVWFAVNAVTDHDGMLEALRDRYAGRIDTMDGRGAEQRWSHVVDLMGRLDDEQLSVPTLAGESVHDKRIVARARDKTGKSSLEHRMLSPAMMSTPRTRFRDHVRFGSWSKFPVSPRPFFDLLDPGSDFTSKGRSDTAATALERRVARLDTKRLSADERIALHRAAHTAWVVLQEHSDDSYGIIGQSRGDAWTTYLQLRPLNDSLWWWTDLCGLVVDEDFGLFFQNETEHWAVLDPALVSEVEAVLDLYAIQLASAHLRYLAASATEAAAWLAATHQRTDRYVPLAKRLSPAGWIVVEAMAKAANATGDAALARSIYDAASSQSDVVHPNLVRSAALTLGYNLASDGPTPKSDARS